MNTTMRAARLVAKFDFVPEFPDELHVRVGDQLFGIDDMDGWWVAGLVTSGQIGLIPKSYVDVEHPPAHSAEPAW